MSGEGGLTQSERFGRPWDEKRDRFERVRLASGFGGCRQIRTATATRRRLAMGGWPLGADYSLEELNLTAQCAR